MTIPCGEQPAPEGTLLAIRPTLPKGGSVAVALKLPADRAEIVGWIRDYDPRFAWSYQLREPLLIPATTIISAQPSTSECSITLTVLKR